jgi:uncharacterized repeat protein (TIGR02543 family)
VRSGYTFTGWKVTDRLGISVNGPNAAAANTYGVLAGGVDTVMIVKLTAQWSENSTYTIMYSTNGGTPGSIANKTNVKWTDTGHLPIAPVRTGYTFTGWKITERNGTAVNGPNATAANTYGVLAGGADTVMSVKLTAQWTENSSYTVIYNVNGGTPQTANKTGVRWTQTALVPAAPTRTGYTFTGWKVTNRGSLPVNGPIATAGSSYGVLAGGADTVMSVTLTAQWSENSNYTVMYDTNGGTPASIANKTNVRWTNTGLLPAMPVRTGYTFTGWKLTNKGGSPVNGPIATAADSYGALAVADTVSSITLSAQWTENSNYRVSYDTNGGIPAVIADKTGVKWTNASLIPSAPVRAGYTFTGWRLTARGGTPVYGPVATSSSTYGSLAVNDKVMVITLSAQWTANTNTPYKISHYKVVGTDVNLAETRSTVGTTDVTVSEAAKSYPGYTYEPGYPGTLTSAPIAGDGSMHLKLYYRANPATAYKVEHYLVDAWNVATLKDTDGKTGMTDTATSYTAKVYPGYTLDLSYPGTVQSSLIAGDGSTTLKLYYAPNTDTPYKLTHYKVVISDIKPEIEQTRRGTTTDIATEAPKSFPGYTYAPGYPGTLTSAPIAGDGSTHLKLYYEANPDTPYTVEHYTVDANDNSVLQATENLTGMTDTAALYTKRSYTRHLLDLGYRLSTHNQTINGDGSTVVRLYYVVTYIVDFVDWDAKLLSEQEIILGYDATEPEAPTRYMYVFYDWDGNYRNVDSDRTLTANYIPADYWSGPPEAPQPAPGTGTPSNTGPASPAAPGVSTPAAPGAAGAGAGGTTTPGTTPESPAEAPVVISPIPTPEAQPPQAEQPAPPIAEQPAPSAGTGSWALLNLLISFITLIVTVLLLVTYFTKGKREENEYESDEANKHLLWRLLGVAVTVVSIILFILTEDISQPMAVFDRFTLIHAALLVVQLVFALFSRKSYDDSEKGELL